MTGLEISGETVRKVKANWPDLKIVQADCRTSPFPSDTFDGVVSLGVVEHFSAGPQAPLADIYRVLKPGGTAIVTVPCLNGIRRLKRMLWWREIRKFPRAFRERLCQGKRRPMTRLQKHFRYVVQPAFGDFF